MKKLKDIYDKIFELPVVPPESFISAYKALRCIAE